MSDFLDNLNLPGAWVKDALCAQIGGDMWHPEKGGSTKEAKRVCMACPARQACLEYALDRDERYGIYGGKSERERRKIAAQRVTERAAATAPPVVTATAAPAAAPGELTARQAEVLQLRQDGLSNPEITELLHISMTTLSGHLTAIRKAGHVLTHPRPTDTEDREDTTWDDCGTPAALARHKHQKVTTCEACLEANRVISREARARKRAAA